MSLRVLEPGLFTLTVDQGRPQSRSLGVPVGGAADATALALGNALVGNPPEAAALEISLAGPTLQAECDLACVLAGAPFDIHCGLRPLRANTTFTLHAGEVLHIRGTPSGMRGYFCVHGGLLTRPILGSRSGLQPLQAGDTIPCSANRIGGRFVQVEWQWDEDERKRKSIGPDDSSAKLLRVIDGPQSDWFRREDIFGSPDDPPPSFIVTPASNRMGLRLRGEPLRMPDRELVSEPVCPGVVQATRDGQLIILGVDGQTIGGYPKIVQVIRADIDKLGQLRPGARVVFQAVELAKARHLYQRKMAELRDWLLRLQTAEVMKS
jgi:5-oxoprolinase (ATP-hydrolysing) subunit C